MCACTLSGGALGGLKELEGFVPTVLSSKLGQKGFIISSICVKGGLVSTRGMLRWREIRDEKIIRNWQSHRKSNMHFRLRRNAHPLTWYQEIKLTICAQLLDSNIAVPSQGADKFQADRMMVAGGFFWQRRANQTNSEVRIISSLGEKGPSLTQTAANAPHNCIGTV